jgi:hypothetical protein
MKGNRSSYQRSYYSRLGTGFRVIHFVEFELVRSTASFRLLETENSNFGDGLPSEKRQKHINSNWRYVIIPILITGNLLIASNKKGLAEIVQ